MAKGISLHIGLNRVDPSHYRGDSVMESWEGPLDGCEPDAILMENLAKVQGFATQLLLTQEATRANVKSAILSAAAELEAGDFFFLTYSGHGSQVADISRDEMEDSDLPGAKKDRRDETWCLYDAQLLDDELFAMWGQFKKGVRILIFSDSCHSGTVSKALGENEPVVPPGTAARLVPRETLENTYKKHRAFYDHLQSPPGQRPTVEARVLLFSGCQDDELSLENTITKHGYFTLGVLDTWNHENFNNYQEFFEILKSKIPEGQTPNFYKFGGDDTDFEMQVPLVIA